MSADGERRRAWSAAVPWVAVLGLLSMRPASAGDVPEGCEFSDASRPILLAQATLPAAQGETVATPTTRQPPRPSASPPTEHLRPPQEQELKPLGEVLRALAKSETSATTLAALGEGRPFSLDRYAVLLGDVRSILVYLQAGDLRARLDKTNAIKGEARTSFESRLQIMETCAPARFVDRGGNESFQKTVALVRKSRSDLQPVVFQAIAAPGRVPAASAPATSQGTGALR